MILLDKKKKEYLFYKAIKFGFNISVILLDSYLNLNSKKNKNPSNEPLYQLRNKILFC